MAASPFQSQLVFVQFGLDAAAEPVHLPRPDQVAPRSYGNAAAAPRRRATYTGTAVTWTGCGTSNPRPPPEAAHFAAPSRLFSAAPATGVSCLGQQWVKISMADRKSVV